MRWGVLDVYLVKKDLCAGGAGRYGHRAGGSLVGVDLVKKDL